MNQINYKDQKYSNFFSLVHRLICEIKKDRNNKNELEEFTNRIIKVIDFILSKENEHHEICNYIKANMNNEVTEYFRYEFKKTQGKITKIQRKYIEEYKLLQMQKEDLNLNLDYKDSKYYDYFFLIKLLVSNSRNCIPQNRIYLAINFISKQNDVRYKEICNYVIINLKNIKHEINNEFIKFIEEIPEFIIGLNKNPVLISSKVKISDEMKNFTNDYYRLYYQFHEKYFLKYKKEIDNRSLKFNEKLNFLENNVLDNFHNIKFINLKRKQKSIIHNNNILIFEIDLSKEDNSKIKEKLEEYISLMINKISKEFVEYGDMFNLEFGEYKEDFYYCETPFFSNGIYNLENFIKYSLKELNKKLNNIKIYRLILKINIDNIEFGNLFY